MKRGFHFTMTLLGSKLRRIVVISLLLSIFSIKAIASNYYWVGGSGNWSDLNHWATTSGGTTLHTQIPTALDDVFFDAGSGFTAASKTVTINASTAFCHNMDWTGASNNPALAGNYLNTLNVYGSLTFIAAMSLPFAGDVNFEATGLGNTITTAGQSFKRQVYFEGAGGGWILQDALTINGYLEFVRGSLNTNNQIASFLVFHSYNTNTRSLTLGSSILNCGNDWIVDHTNLVLNAGTSTINMTGVDVGFATFIQTPTTYYDLNFTNPNSSTAKGIGEHISTLQFHNVTFSGCAIIEGDNVFNNLTFAGGKTYELERGFTQTINSNLNTGTACNGLVNIQSDLVGTQAMIRKNSGTLTIDYSSLKDINAGGGAAFTANHSIDLGNNTGWTINTPTSQNLYWVGGSGNWTDQAHWSLTSGGGGGACVPTAYDNVFFNANAGFTAGNNTVVINTAAAFCHNMDWTGATNNPVFTGNFPNTLRICGSLKFISAMSFNFTGSVYFEASDLGNTITCAGKSINNYAIFDGTGGWILTDALTVVGTIQFLWGFLNTNNQTLNFWVFSSRDGNTRSLTLGSSILNCSSFWQVNHANLSFSPGSSLINMTGLNGGFQADVSTTAIYFDLNFTNPASIVHGIDVHGGTLQFHNVLFSGGGDIKGDNVFNNLALAPGKTYQLENGVTQTINGNLNANSTCVGGLINIQSDITGSQAFVRKNSGSITNDYVTLRDINASGGAVFTANHSVDLGNNAGWTINAAAPQDLYWVGAAGNWNDQSHWSLSSGGAGGACIPSPSDNVFFDANAGFTPASKTVTINASTASCHNMDWTGAPNSPILAGASPNSLKIYGSLKFIAAMSFLFTGETYFVATSLGNTITSNGQSFKVNVFFDGLGGGWILQDAFTGSVNIEFARGSLNTNNQTVNTQGILSYSFNTRSLILGSSIINCNYVWSMHHTNLVFDAGTSTINMSAADPDFLPYVSSSATYYNLNFTNTGSTALSKCIMQHGGTVQFHDVTFSGSGGIQGVNTFNNLTFAAGKTYELQSGITQTVQDHWRIQGSCTSYILIQSSINGSFASVNKTSGDVLGFNLHVRDIHCFGGAYFHAYNSVDLGGNAGWDFSALPPLSDPSIIVGPSPVCPGSTGVIYYTAPVPGAIYYQWTVPVGATIISGQGDPQIVVDFGTATSGNITVQTFDGCNYSASSGVLPVVVAGNLIPAVALAANPAGPVCAGTPITFTATATNTGTSVVNYDFQVNGISVQSGVSNTYVTTSLVNGDIVTCNISVSASACFLSTTATSNPILINTNGTASTPTVSLTAIPAGPICSGTPVTFTAAASTNGTGMITYDFKVNGVSLQNGASNLFTTALLSNSDVVTCGISISGGTCYLSTTAVSNSIVLNVIATPSLTINVSANNICAGTPVTFTATPVNAGSSPNFQWQLNGNNTGANSSTYFNSSLNNGDHVNCIMTTSTTCAASLNIASNTITMLIIPKPVISFNPANPTIIIGDEVQLNASVNTNVSSYLWTPATGLSNTGVHNPIARPRNSTTYHLHITGAGSCNADSSILVKVLDGIYIPNAFVPSGVNNIFRIPPGTAIKDLQYFEIYNRWGNLVFKTNDINAGWDGTYKGKPADQGTFTYMIKAADAHGPLLLKGTVNLIR